MDNTIGTTYDEAISEAKHMASIIGCQYDVLSTPHGYMSASDNLAQKLHFPIVATVASCGCVSGMSFSLTTPCTAHA
jgi:hypothetical protein